MSTLRGAVHNFSIFEILAQFLLVNDPLFKNEINEILNKTVKSIFNNKTLIFLSKINRKVIANKLINKQQIFNYIFESLISYNNESLAIILYNLNILEDFNVELERRYPILEKLLSSYQYFDIEKMTNNSYKGSSILGCLMKDNNQYLVEDYLKKLLKNKKISNNISCIGAGSTCLVYKIGDSVIKLSERRHNRKIFVNHRILASQVRDLLKNGDKELFFVEVMKYLSNTKVTQEECEELKYDLFRQGINWQDAKIENCGLLNANDDNISDLNYDCNEMYAIVDNPVDREDFMKRKRKVVVLDNDDMVPLPKLYWK